MKGRFNPEGTTFTFAMPDLSGIVGCSTGEDEFVHLGGLFSRLTVCGEGFKSVILSGEITVNCPACVAKIKTSTK